MSDRWLQFLIPGAVALIGVALAGTAMADKSRSLAEHSVASTLVHREQVHYSTPSVTLVREDGRQVTFPQELDDGRPVYMNFIFTTCATICPLSSAVFEQLQAKLGPRRDRAHLVSVSIDPEQDTPVRLRDYARRFHAGRGWHHYTGTVEASIAVQRAFNVYRGDKMSHVPVTLFRPAPGAPWVRIDGIASASDLYREISQLMAKR